MSDQMRGRIHEDDDGVDRVEIITVPRFKTSGMSGDEWRVSALIRVYRKGDLVHERGVRDIETAAKLLPWLLVTLPETKGVPALWAPPLSKCYQPGCDRVAVSTYRLKKEICAGPGKCGQEIESYGPKIRRFCERHLRRGDCGLEDADDNYEVIEGPGPNGTTATPTKANTNAAAPEKP